MMLLLFSYIKVMTSLIFAFSNNKSENMQSRGITPAFSQLDLPTASSAIIRLSQDNVILTKFPENWKLVSNSRNQLQVTQCALSIFCHFIIKKSTVFISHSQHHTVPIYLRTNDYTHSASIRFLVRGDWQVNLQVTQH